MKVTVECKRHGLNSLLSPPAAAPGTAASRTDTISTLPPSSTTPAAIFCHGSSTASCRLREQPLPALFSKAKHAGTSGVKPRSCSLKKKDTVQKVLTPKSSSRLTPVLITHSPTGSSLVSLLGAFAVWFYFSCEVRSAFKTNLKLHNEPRSFI